MHLLKQYNDFVRDRGVVNKHTSNIVETKTIFFIIHWTAEETSVYENDSWKFPIEISLHFLEESYFWH